MTSSTRAPGDPLSTSALFLLTSDAVVDRVVEGFEGTQMALIATNLSADDE